MGERARETDRLSDDDLFKGLFLALEQVPHRVLGVTLAAHRNREVHVHEKAFVFKANELAIVKDLRSAKAEVDRADRRFRRRQHGR